MSDKARQMKLSVTLEGELFEWLKRQAERDHRSVAGQIRFFLDRERQTKADVCVGGEGSENGD